MRILKFRQKKLRHIEGDMFHYWGYIDNNCDCFVAPLSMAQGVQNSQQFTGLHDRQGVEIYEGDIVIHRRHWDDGRITSEVKNFGIHPFYCGDWSIMPDECEVIGNTHQNPELLEDGKKASS